MPLFRKGSGSSKGGAPPPYSEPEGLYVAQPVHGEPPVYDSTALYTAKEPTPKNQGLGVLLKMEPGPIRDGRPETMCVIHDIRKGALCCFVAVRKSAIYVPARQGVPRGSTNKYESACASSKSTTRCRASAGITKAQLAKRPYAPPVRVTCAE